MKRLSLILSLVFLVALSSPGYAGINFGMTGAVKEKVEKLDEKVKGVVPTEEKKQEAKLKVEEAMTLFEDAMDSLGESQDYGDENYRNAVENLKKTNYLFKQALEKDPNNPEANLGAALTETILIGEDPEIKEAIEKLEEWLESLSFSGEEAERYTLAAALVVALAATDDLPTINELQGIIKNKILPKIDYIIERLETVEDSSWEFTVYEFEADSEMIIDMLPPYIIEIFGEVSGEEFGEVGNGKVEIDKTDVYAADAGFWLLKSFLAVLCAYNLDIVYEDLKDMNKIMEVLQKIVEKKSPYDKFLTLKDSEILKTAGNSLDVFAAKFLTAMDSLENETDDQKDDLLSKPEDIFNEDWEKVKHALNQLRDALKGPITINLSYYYDVIPEIEINLAAFFFTNQIRDLRDYIIPAVETWPWEGSLELKFKDIDNDGLTPDWNDPTFNGILPGMTNKKLKEVIGETNGY